MGELKEPVPTAQAGSGTAQFRRHIGRLGYFALAFGGIVGSGWVVVLGEWLGAAGPGGAALAFAAGGLAMALICACYAELTARMPHTGAEFVYVRASLGPIAGFLVGWFLLLNFIGLAAFEGTALVWLLSAMMPSIEGASLYHVLGQPVRVGGLVVSMGGIVLLAWLNGRGSGATVIFQKVMTYGFLVFALILIGLGLSLGDLSNARPLFQTGQDGAPDWSGVFWVFSLGILFLNGFQGAAQVAEERAHGVSLRAVAGTMVAAVVAATLFYILVIFAVAASTPWRETVAAGLPTAHAFGALIPSAPWLADMVIVIAIASLLKTWNVIFIIGARLVVALARDGFLPPVFARLNARSAPSLAVAIFAAVAALAVLLGPGAIMPILNLCAMCLAVTFVLLLIVLLKERAAGGAEPEFRVPGNALPIVIALLLVVTMGSAAAVMPLLRAKGMPIEWLLMAGWAAVGLVLILWSRGARRQI